jgi:TolB-like protein/tetratricopeptide (TPR) repeat protein
VTPVVSGKIYCFEGLTLDLTRGCLRRRGQEIELRPKSFELLRYLVENAGRLISKDELIEAVWPNVAATDESLARCVSEVRSALGDGEQRVVKTVPRRGYVFAAKLSPSQAHGVGLVGTNASRPIAARRLSIVILPFVNLSGDAEQEYFVDAITENLTTDLSRVPGALVIARNTAFTFKGQTVDAREVGRKLGVRYVMEGSVQTSQDRVRVNAQLIDAETGAHLWAERFDKRRADLFDMEDEITVRLARTVGVELVAAEGRRAECKRPGNMDAIDLAMRGRAAMNQPPSAQSSRAARALFEAALQLDDRNVEALVGLADAHASEVRGYAATDRPNQVNAAQAAIEKALVLAPNSAHAHYVRAEVLQLMRAPEQALEECELAVALDRNLPSAHAFAGFMKLMLGRGEETEAHIHEAIRLSPSDPGLYDWYGLLGVADIFLGRPERAVENLRRSVGLNPYRAIGKLLLAAALALTGRMAEAAEAREAGLKLNPNFSVAKYRDDRRSDHPVYLQQRERMYEGLSKAGVPEGP